MNKRQKRLPPMAGCAPYVGDAYQQADVESDEEKAAHELWRVIQ